MIKAFCKSFRKKMFPNVCTFAYTHTHTQTCLNIYKTALISSERCKYYINTFSPKGSRGFSLNGKIYTHCH